VRGDLRGELKHDAMRKVGLKHFTPHDVRRSVRTGLSRIGVRDEIAEAALGHVVIVLAK
jgi:integrase